jgi:anti-anti-sigma factor
VRNAQSTLAVDVRPDGATVVVRLDGDLDITSSPLLQAVVDQVLVARRRPPCTHLVVDMSGVGFADASGISPLLLARAMLARRDGRVELRHCRRAVLRLVRLLDLRDMLADEAPHVG